MVDLLDIARGGVLAYRSALGVTGENIANVDTEGYRRRDVVTQEVGLGAGVEVVDIRRAFDGLIAARGRDAQSTLGAAQTQLSHVQALEDRLLPGEGGLPDLLDGFFDALDGLSLAPDDQGLRQAVLSAGTALAGGVADLAEGIDVLARNVSDETQQAVGRANSILDGLAEVQLRLSQITDEGARNPLLDQRDRLLVNLSELVAVDVTLDDAGRATVRLGADGSGPTILEGGRAGRLEQGTAGRLTVTPVDPKAPEVQTFAVGGILGGLADAAGAIAQAGADLDQWAARLVEQTNAVHAKGLTPSGEHGSTLFSLSGWESEPGALMRGTGSAKITITDASQMPEGPLALVHDAPTGLWQARDAAGQVLATGAQTLSLPGLRIDMSGVPLDGDRIALTRHDASARYMKMVLDDPQGIAAAGTLTVSSVPGNRGTATLSATTLTPSATGLTDLSGVLGGETVEFLSAGVVGVIPSGTGSAELSVQPRLAAMDLALPSGADPQTLSLTMPVEGEVVFDLPSGLDAATLAEALNAGTLESASGQKLSDLGLVAEATSGTLTLLARDAALPSAASLATDLGTVTGVVVADAAPAATLSVFTRDGRQLSGPPLSADEAAALLTTENGFYPDAVYRADYLEAAAPYGGLTYERQSVRGDYSALLGQAGGIATWTGSTPAPETSGAVIAYEGGAQSSTLRLPDGASAAWAEQELADALPVRAEAETRLALDLPESGVLSLRLTGQNLTPVTIQTDLGAGGAAGLQAAINAQSGGTGIRAELSPNGDRLVLVQADGADITVSQLAHSNAEPVTVTRLAPDGAALGTVSLGAAGPDAVRVSGTVRLSGTAAFGVTENGVLQTAQTDGFSNGQITRQTDYAGARVILTPAEPGPGDLGLRRIAVTGSDGRVVTAEADPALGTGAAMAAALAADLRATAPASRITGAALAALPPEGAQMRVSLGAQDYVIRMSGGEPVVSGPEAGRITARFDENNQLVLETQGGTLDGAALRLPADAGEAARFGMGIGDAPVATIIGQPFDAGNLPTSFSITLDGQEHPISVTAGGVVLPASFPGTGHINTTFGRVEIYFSAHSGEMMINAQEGAVAAGFNTLGLRTDVSDGTLRLTATDDRVLSVQSVAGQSGSVLRLTNIPDEDLLVVMGGSGALRLAGQIGADSATERTRELRVLDAATGLVGLFDRESGAHLASRTLDAAGTARFGDLEVTLGGGRVTGDSYVLTPNAGGAGDGRSIEALANLRQRDGLTGQGGYATSFASLQQRAGAQVTAGQSRVATAEAEVESAARAESELSGVDLDAEAAQLMQQQQAYQANAQVLSVARALFDTLLQAI
ncbi:FlgK family flagellar hook-associated protein [Roseovarius sp.]|uniref:FlgK family flagellar hook-associated protein n=1 Tax=Roseovarius sp. TaxID=1486281 RepID=UPI003A969E1E